MDPRREIARAAADAALDAEWAAVTQSDTSVPLPDEDAGGPLVCPSATSNALTEEFGFEVQLNYDDQDYLVLMDAELRRLDEYGMLDGLNAIVDDPTRFDSDIKHRASGLYDTESKELYVAPEEVIGEQPRERDPRDGYFSTDKNFGSVWHELGHHRIREENPGMSFEPEEGEEDWGENTLDEVGRDRIEETVSEYAAEAGMEFIAEVHAGKIAGNEYPAWVEDAYEELHGPHVPEGVRNPDTAFETMLVEPQAVEQQAAGRVLTNVEDGAPPSVHQFAKWADSVTSARDVKLTSHASIGGGTHYSVDFDLSFGNSFRSSANIRSDGTVKSVLLRMPVIPIEGWDGGSGIGDPEVADRTTRLREDVERFLEQMDPPLGAHEWDVTTVREGNDAGPAPHIKFSPDDESVPVRKVQNFIDGFHDAYLRHFDAIEEPGPFAGKDGSLFGRAVEQQAVGRRADRFERALKEKAAEWVEQEWMIDAFTDELQDRVTLGIRLFPNAHDVNPSDLHFDKETGKLQKSILRFPDVPGGPVGLASAEHEERSERIREAVSTVSMPASIRVMPDETIAAGHTGETPHVVFDERSKTPPKEFARWVGDLRAALREEFDMDAGEWDRPGYAHFVFDNEEDQRRALEKMQAEWGDAFVDALRQLVSVEDGIADALDESPDDVMQSILAEDGGLRAGEPLDTFERVPGNATGKHFVTLLLHVLRENYDKEQELGMVVAQEPGEWQEYEFGDEQFIGHGDMVAFEKDGERVEAEVREVVDDLVGVTLPDGDNFTIEVWDIDEFKIEGDDLSGLRGELREWFENRGVGSHSKALEEYTNDKRYREIQEHLRNAVGVAKESPFYDENPEMETVSATLATLPEDEARLLRDIQTAAKMDLPREMTVYRGVGVDTESFFQKAEAAMDSGRRLSDAGFQSATLDRDVAEGFGNVLMEIVTDHGVYVRAASEFAGEDEVLLPAGTEYEVMSIDRASNTVRVRALGGSDFGAVDVGHIRQVMEEEGLSYGEAIDRVV